MHLPCVIYGQAALVCQVLNVRLNFPATGFTMNRVRPTLYQWGATLWAKKLRVFDQFGQGRHLNLDVFELTFLLKNLFLVERSVLSEPFNLSELAFDSFGQRLC